MGLTDYSKSGGGGVHNTNSAILYSPAGPMHGLPLPQTVCSPSHSYLAGGMTHMPLLTSAQSSRGRRPSAGLDVQHGSKNHQQQQQNSLEAQHLGPQQLFRVAPMLGQQPLEGVEQLQTLPLSLQTQPPQQHSQGTAVEPCPQVLVGYTGGEIPYTAGGRINSSVAGEKPQYNKKGVLVGECSGCLVH